jgi:hypothetical protein
MAKLTDAQKARRAATRQRNAAMRDALLSNQARLKAKLAKVEAFAADKRGNENMRAVAVETAAKLKGMDPLRMPTMEELLARRQGKTFERAALKEQEFRHKTRHRGRLKGAVQYRLDVDLLPMLDVVIRTAARKGIKPFAAIRLFMRSHGGLFGCSDNAVAHRLYQKWRAGQFRKWRPPPGIDPDRFYF